MLHNAILWYIMLYSAIQVYIHFMYTQITSGVCNMCVCAANQQSGATTQTSGLRVLSCQLATMTQITASGLWVHYYNPHLQCQVEIRNQNTTSGTQVKCVCESRVHAFNRKSGVTTPNATYTNRTAMPTQIPLTSIEGFGDHGYQLIACSVQCHRASAGSGSVVCCPKPSKDCSPCCLQLGKLSTQTHRTQTHRTSCYYKDSVFVAIFRWCRHKIYKM